LQKLNRMLSFKAS